MVVNLTTKTSSKNWYNFSQEKAQLLGYKSFADYVLEEKYGEIFHRKCKGF